MEQLHFQFDGCVPTTASAPSIVGVVASGNLEVMIEPTPGVNVCAIDVSTAANGFGAVWQAVLGDFFDRHRIGGIRVSINDNGATPAIVALRLDQAIEEFTRA